MVVTGRDQARGDAVSAEIAARRRHRRVRAGRPRRRAGAVTQLVDTAADRMGGLTVLVNNAAGGDAPDGAGRRPHRPRRGTRSCASTSPRRCGAPRAAIPHMRAAGHGVDRQHLEPPGRAREPPASPRTSRPRPASTGSPARSRSTTPPTGSAATRSAPATCSTTAATPTSRRNAAPRYEGMHLTRLGDAADVAVRVPCTSRAASRSSSPASTCSSTAAAASPAAARSAEAMRCTRARA